MDQSKYDTYNFRRIRNDGVFNYFKIEIKLFEL